MPALTFELGLTLEKPPVAAAADELGAAVAALGNTVVLGAPGDGSAGVNAGAAFLVDGDPTSPTFGTVLQTLTAPRPAAGQQFGTAVAVVGNGASSGVLVGAPTDSAAAADAGAAYLFDAATGALRQTFTKPITFSVVEELLPDTDLFEHYCLENEKDDAHIRGAAPR